MLEYFANHAVCSEQVWGGYSFAVWRVCHHYGLVLWLLEVLEVGQGHADVLGQSGGAYVQVGFLYGVGVDVVAVYMVVELALLRVVVVDAVEEFGVEVGPFLKRIALAEHAGSHIAGYEGGFDKQRPGAAHRVDEVGVAFPSRHENHSGGEHFVKRCFNGLLPVAAAVQAFAARVE